ncbi:hypothetical protein SAMN05421736_101677 [Evansella caseinilytica]|uniref:Uncharacterized protein n=1 Tax=Evansella caseinilytica TaxID=1503961 RepID=A0A1H3I0U1_9BACI|nr:hypothetical protein [Evansella caseinilytica]SDY21311.1 hypothetical protein SAMN05421736_101677 [Evansella caseinilytica]
MKKITVLIFLTVFLILLDSIGAFAEENTTEVGEHELNDFLKNLGVPLDVINELTYAGKFEIYNTIDSDAVFDGYSEQDVYLPEEGIGEISPMSIPKSQLQLKVTGFKNNDGSYSIYPSFIWKQKARLRNDSFGFALDSSNWSTVAGIVGLNVHMVNATAGHTDYYYYDRPSTSSYAGHVFKIPTNHGTTNHLHYEGHAHFKAKPKGSKVDKRIILRYGDDTTTRGTTSYGISIGVFSVSYPNPKGNFRQTAETLSW